MPKEVICGRCNKLVTTAYWYCARCKRRFHDPCFTRDEQLAGQCNDCRKEAGADENRKD